MTTSLQDRTRSEAEAPPAAQAIERALAVLEAFSARRPELGVNELARIVDTTPSTMSRLLSALESRGYLQQHETTGRFRLGIRALELGYRYADTSELLIRAAPHVDALAQQLKLRVDLYGLDGGQLVRYLSAAAPPAQTLIGGWRFYPHGSAAGHVLLAALSPQTLARALAESPPPPPADATDQAAAEGLQARLEATRHDGYAADDGAAGTGKRSLAVPVRDATGAVVAALSVSGPASRLSEEEIPALLEVLFDRAFEFSKSLGYRPHQALCEPPS
jgi:IclR family pca regulon transcriptional regulator